MQVLRENIARQLQVLHDLKKENEAESFCPSDVCELLDRAIAPPNNEEHDDAITDFMTKALLYPPNRHCRISAAGKQLFVIAFFSRLTEDETRHRIESSFHSLTRLLQLENCPTSSISRAVVILGNMLKVHQLVVAGLLAEVFLGLCETNVSNTDRAYTTMSMFLCESIHCLNQVESNVKLKFENEIKIRFQNWCEELDTTPKQRTKSIALMDALFTGSSKLRLTLLKYTKSDPIASVRAATVKSFTVWLSTALNDLKQLVEDEQDFAGSIREVKPLFHECTVVSAETDLDSSVTTRVAGLALKYLITTYTKTVKIFEARAFRYVADSLNYGNALLTLFFGWLRFSQIALTQLVRSLRDQHEPVRTKARELIVAGGANNNEYDSDCIGMHGIISMFGLERAVKSLEAMEISTQHLDPGNFIVYIY